MSSALKTEKACPEIYPSNQWREQYLRTQSIMSKAMVALENIENSGNCK